MRAARAVQARVAALWDDAVTMTARREALRGLGEAARLEGGVAAREALIDALGFVEATPRLPWPLRSQAAQGLAEAPGEAAARALALASVEDESPWVRSAAAAALRRAPGREALWLAVEAEAAWARAQGEAGAALRVRWLRLLGRLPKAAPIIALLRGVEDQAWSVRAAAYAALGRRANTLEPGEIEAVNAALKAGLYDPDPSAREAAAEALAAEALAPHAAHALIDVARRDASPRVRAAALIGLNQRARSPQAVEVAQRALDDEDTAVRCHAADLLSGQGEAARPALPRMIDRLSDGAQVGFALKRSLAALGRADPWVVERLWAALDHPQAVTRSSALRVLGDIGPNTSLEDERRVLRLIDDPSQAVWSAVGWFVQRAPAWSAEGVAGLCQRAESRAYHKRLRALELLHKVDLDRDTLHQVLWWRLRDSVPMVRREAIDLLETKKDHASSALPQFIRRLYDRDEYVYNMAKHTLTRLDGRLPAWFDEGALKDPAATLLCQLARRPEALQARLSRRAAAHAAWYAGLLRRAHPQGEQLVEILRPKVEAPDAWMEAAMAHAEAFAARRGGRQAEAQAEIALRARAREAAWLLAGLLELDLAG
ncbi:HEAT repeat domain-containing protein [Myxococcota bacterium]|nr:HEAT repeat domain-containing protein [Myxococcota bacterium]